MTDGPFAEAAEVACGYYVFEADNLDDALALARDIPAAQHGGIEVWPIVHAFDPEWSGRGAHWLALLQEPPASAFVPGTPEWEAEAARHGEFAAAAGDHIVGGAALRESATATTVRVRDGQALLTDGPYVEGAEIATGFYLLDATDRDEAVKLAAMIPASSVQLRRLAGSPACSAWPTWTASFGGNGARPWPRWRAGRATSPSPRTPSRKPAPRRFAPGPATVCPTIPAAGW